MFVVPLPLSIAIALWMAALLLRIVFWLVVTMLRLLRLTLAVTFRLGVARRKVDVLADAK